MEVLLTPYAISPSHSLAAGRLCGNVLYESPEALDFCLNLSVLLSAASQHRKVILRSTGKITRLFSERLLYESPTWNASRALRQAAEFLRLSGGLPVARSVSSRDCCGSSLLEIRLVFSHSNDSREEESSLQQDSRTSAAVAAARKMWLIVSGKNKCEHDRGEDEAAAAAAADDDDVHDDDANGSDEVLVLMMMTMWAIQ